jgi:RTX calcium-binding nonapeptide repeat (4 copies)
MTDGTDHQGRIFEMRTSRIQRLAAVLGITCAGAAPAVPASAATTASVFPPYDDSRFSEPGGLAVNGDRGSNDIAVGFNSTRGTFVVEDSKATVQAKNCARLTRHKVRCNADPSERGIVSVYADGNARTDGDDRIRIRHSVPSETHLSGGRGHDVIIGGRQHDSIGGSSGNDLLDGRAGHDLLDGWSGSDIERGGPGRDDLGLGYYNRGSDSFFGGGGSDTLWTVDGTADRRIACGQGGDSAEVEANERPRVVGCEDVKIGALPPWIDPGSH